MAPLIDLKKATLPIVITVMLVCFARLQQAQAVSPAPDGGYPGFNTAEGQKALFSLTTGSGNTAVGWFSLWGNTTGSFNTATGVGTLLFNTADENTAVGAAALLRNTTGSSNTAVGATALFQNTAGAANTALGAGALLSNTTGNANTAVGTAALEFNTMANSNTALGHDALFFNTIGDGNTASGSGALTQNTTGNDNTANGATALLGNTTGSNNTAMGVGALFSNSTGGNNTAYGFQALANNTTGSFNIALQGGFHLTTGDFNIDIGSDGVAGEGNTIRIGDGCCQSQTFIAGISGTAVTGSIVVVNGDGQLGVAPSSARFKEEIKPMNKASETILKLRPVAFRYKPELDPERVQQFGLVAEEVEKVSPDLVVRDKEGRPYTVRYDAVNAMLLNEFLKEHRAFVEEQRQVQEQSATIVHLERQIEALAAGLQKVSAQLETTKPAPQVVNNP
ncbi:MAG: tail fiber domain-containing protein [Nitrospirota bacterium]|jgi:hypothetical protein